MIVTDLAHAREQSGPVPGLRKALEFLTAAQARPPADGRIEIDGDRAYALVSSYQTARASEPLAFEAHRKYIDVHFVLSGEEIVAWAPIERLSVTREYDAAKDVWFGTLCAGAATPVWLVTGYLAVLYPEDGHAPKLAAGEPVAVKKIVVKVALEGQHGGDDGHSTGIV